MNCNLSDLEKDEEKIAGLLRNDDDLHLVIRILSKLADDWKDWTKTASGDVYAGIGRIVSKYEARRKNNDHQRVAEDAPAEG